MREIGLAGVRRGKAKRTTVADEAAHRRADLVTWRIRADQLWCAT